MKFGVLVFPGSNCDHDAYWVAGQVAKQPVTFLWHESQDLENCDAIIVPGGFAYGDYLRTGAIARFAPVMGAVREFAERGGLVFGICNGFQILLEAGLLPGAMLRNRSLKYRCEHVHVRVERTDTPFTCAAKAGQVLSIPIGHGGPSLYAFTADPLTALCSDKVGRHTVIVLPTGPGLRSQTCPPNLSMMVLAVASSSPVLSRLPPTNDRSKTCVDPHSCEPPLSGCAPA